MRAVFMVLLWLPFLAMAGGGKPATAETTEVQKTGLSDHLFVTSSQCMACHNRLSDRNGADHSIGTSWRSAMMSNSVTDPYWQAGVRRETMDHPESAAAIEDVCSSCHMPMARFIAQYSGGKGAVFSNLTRGNTRTDESLAALAGDGISCTVCHQIKPDNLGKKESFGAGFLVDTLIPQGNRAIFGPFDINTGNSRVMNSAAGFTPEKASHIRESALCGSCHTLYTHAIDPNGKIVAELPEQMPYVEWLHSDYAEVKSCQDCHMKHVEGEAAISAVMGVPRSDLKKHTFTGGNFFMLRMLSKNAAAMGISALPAELNAASDASLSLLSDSTATVNVDTAAISLDNDTIIVPVVIENHAGHKLPTAYPSRRAWIHFTATDGDGNTVLESGRLNPDGSIAGNDNDEDPLKFEPHHAIISRDSQVQIYESIMAAPDGSVTTGLLKGASYVKDNRIPPLGFSKKAVPKDVAVWGNAAADPDFDNGGDRIIYRFPKGISQGAFKIKVEFRYQPIGFRWADNISSVKAVETDRFTTMYRTMDGHATAVLVASDEYSIPASSIKQAPPKPE